MKTYFDWTEKAYNAVADAQEEAGKVTGVGLLAGIGGFQAEVTRGIGETYVAVGRKLIG